MTWASPRVAFGTWVAAVSALFSASCNSGYAGPNRSPAAQERPPSLEASEPASALHANLVAPRSEPLARVAPKEPEPPVHYPFHDPLPVDVLAKAPATRYANLSPGACHSELKKRELSVKPAAGPARGIATPLRLTGPLHGIHFVTPGSRSVYGMVDCRLVLALDDLAVILSQKDVVEVQVDNLYRPRAHLPGKKNKRSQHAYGLAVDILSLKLRDGRTLVVEHDWHGAIGSPPCGPDSAVSDPGDETIRLRNLLCDVAREGLFHHLLTPNYDAAHSNHFHLDIKRDEHAIVVR